MTASAPALPPPKRKRRHRSAAVERDACLLLLGFDLARPIEWQHSPPLALRPWDPDTGDYLPAENDPRFLIPMQAVEHKRVTREVDRPAIDKARRQADAQAEFRARLLAKGEPSNRSNRWPKGRKLR